MREAAGGFSSIAEFRERGAFFDYLLLMKFHFFQFYYPETEKALAGRRYGFNIKSQLLKLFVIFPAISALAAWICAML